MPDAPMLCLQFQGVSVEFMVSAGPRALCVLHAAVLHPQPVDARTLTRCRGTNTIKGHEHDLLKLSGWCRSC